MPTRLISARVSDYLDSLVPPRPDEMLAMEAYAKESAFPIIGPATGHLCYQIARMIGARRIFELGSGYGYSTAWFARAVQENGGGKVFHVVWDERLSRMARKHLGVLGYGDIVEYHVAEAVETLRQTPGPFDLIFNDIDKSGYPDALPVIAEKLRPGGVLLVDNMLWHGKIFNRRDRTPDTEGVRRLTELLKADPAWLVSLIPIRDGLMMAFKP